MKSRRAILQMVAIGSAELFAACTFVRNTPDLPPITQPPLKAVIPPPLPTPTPASHKPMVHVITTATSTPQAPATTINVETWGAPTILSAFTEIIQSFEKTMPWITVRSRLDNALTSDSQRARLHGGGRFDITRIAPEDVFDFTASGFLHKLTDRIANDEDLQTVAPRTIDSRVGPSGEQAVLSLGARYQCVLYNMQHFEQAGITPPTRWHDSWTVSEFEQHAQRLVIADHNRVNRFGLTAIPAYIRPVLAEATENDPTGGFVDVTGRISTMTTPERERYLNRLSAWQTTLRVELPIPGRSNTTFNAELAAMYIDRSDVGPSIRQAVPWGVAPLPAWRNRNALTEGEELCVGINSQSDKPDVSWSFVRFLVEPAAQRSLARTDLVIPFRTEVLDDPAVLDPNRRPLDRSILIEANKHSMQSPSHPGSKAWHVMTGPAVIPARRGKQAASDYLRTADRIISNQLEIRARSAGNVRPGYRQALPYGNRLRAKLSPAAG